MTINLGVLASSMRAASSARALSLVASSALMHVETGQSYFVPEGAPGYTPVVEIMGDGSVFIAVPLNTGTSGEGFARVWHLAFDTLAVLGTIDLSFEFDYGNSGLVGWRSASDPTKVVLHHNGNHYSGGSVYERETWIIDCSTSTPTIDTHIPTVSGSDYYVVSPASYPGGYTRLASGLIVMPSARLSVWSDTDVVSVSPTNVYAQPPGWINPSDPNKISFLCQATNNYSWIELDLTDPTTPIESFTDSGIAIPDGGTPDGDGAYTSATYNKMAGTSPYESLKVVVEEDNISIPFTSNDYRLISRNAMTAEILTQTPAEYLIKNDTGAFALPDGGVVGTAEVFVGGGSDPHSGTGPLVYGISVFAVNAEGNSLQRLNVLHSDVDPYVTDTDGWYANVQPCTAVDPVTGRGVVATPGVCRFSGYTGASGDYIFNVMVSTFQA